VEPIGESAAAHLLEGAKNRMERRWAVRVDFVSPRARFVINYYVVDPPLAQVPLEFPGNVKTIAIVEINLEDLPPRWHVGPEPAPRAWMEHFPTYARKKFLGPANGALTLDVGFLYGGRSSLLQGRFFPWHRKCTEEMLFGKATATALCLPPILPTPPSVR
jgi:hypothetical protein